MFSVLVSLASSRSASRKYYTLTPGILSKISSHSPHFAWDTLHRLCLDQLDLGVNIIIALLILFTLTGVLSCSVVSTLLV